MASNLNNTNCNVSEINSSSDLQSLDNSPDTIIPESDNDSGIVAIANSNRIGSTASNSDEDNIFKEKLNHSTNHPFGFGGKPRVRFDDDLPLSEQNMRKSCKKLFETLFHNKEIGLKDESMIVQPSVLPSCHCLHFTQALPQNKTCSQCCTHSESNTITVDTNDSYDDNELILTNYGQQCNYVRDVPLSRQQKCQSLDNRQNRTVRTLDRNVSNVENKSYKQTSFDCNEALDRIKRMSDRLESSSMVNAFARPAFIKSPEYGQTMDTLYETIFPTEKTTNTSNSQVKQWLNKVEAYETTDEEITPQKNKNIEPIVVNRNNVYDHKLVIKDISRSHTLPVTPQKNTYISADQIYPDLCEDDITNEELDKSFEERNNRFASSYSAVDDNKRGILRHRIKSAVSEIDLNQKSSPKSKGFLKRFKSVLSRAFTTDKLTKQSILDLNTQQNSRSISDLRFDLNLRSSRSSIAVDTRTHVDRSPSFVKNLKTRMSFRRNKESPLKSNDKISRTNSQKNIIGDNHRTRQNAPKHSRSTINLECSVWGELIKLNSDSSQVIQIHRQKGRAFGFFVARGTVNKIKGVFISRMKDEETQKSLTGVLEIGDEILAIDGESVKDANIMRVNQLIANKETIRLTIVPYMNNKYL